MFPKTNLVKISKIKGKMAEKGVTGISMAEKLGLSITGFYNKMNGKSSFTADEIGLISMILDTTPNFFYTTCYDNSNKD